MKILIDARYLDGTYTGIGTYSKQLLENLARVDEKNQYLVLVRPSFKGELKLGENFKLVTYSPKPVSLQSLLSLGRYVDSLNVDLMHSFFPIAPLFMRTPLMVTVHDLQPFLDPEFSARRPLPVQLAYRIFYKYTYPAVLKKAKWVLNVSYHTRDNVAALYHEQIPKLIVVTSGLDQRIFDPAPENSAEVREHYGLVNPYLLYFGSTRPNKNIPMMIRAFAHYVRTHQDIETDLVLVLKKDRFFRDISKTIRQEALTERILVLDQLEYEEQRAVLTGAKAFLFPSKYEGFGFPALEAMAAGIPVLASDSGALPEICGEAALVTSADDYEEMGEGIARLVNDRYFRRSLIERGEERARLFKWEGAAEMVRDIYQLLFNRRVKNSKASPAS